MNRQGSFWTVIGLLVLLIPSMALSQETTGTLRGFVTDDQGEALPGAAIEIESPALMSKRSAVTDARGQYRFLYLPPGIYTICARLDAFETCWMKGVAVQIARTSTADILMKPGTLSSTIEVTAEAPLIDLERSSKNYNLSVELLATIPVAQRANYSDVFFTLPGVAGGTTDSPLVNAGGVTRNLAPGMSYFWDQHNQDDAYENKIMVDGMEINDSMSGRSYGLFNYEAIQEMDVKTAGAGAEYGNARSSFMNIVTKSGGNTFRGSLMIQYQSRSLNWSNVEGGTANKINYLIPNATISGPILKDKVWFLASYKYDNEDYLHPNTIVVPEIIRKTRGHMPYLKLTFQPQTKHTISLVYQNDYRKISPNGFPSTAYSELEAANIAKKGGPLASLSWRWLASNALIFNFTAGYNRKPQDTFAVTSEPQYRYTERFQAGSTLLYDTGYGEDYTCPRTNVLVSGNATYYAENLFNTGAHEIKFGVDIRPYQHVDRARIYHVDAHGFYQYRLGLDYAKYGLTAPYIYRAYGVKSAPGLPQDRIDNKVTCSNQNVYLQDTWVANKSLALSFGLRWEHQREYMFYRDELPEFLDAIYPKMRDNVEFDDSGFAPRLGLTYNLGGVGVLKFHYGRYYEYVGTGDYNNYAREVVFPEYRMAAKDIGRGPEALSLYKDPELAYPPHYNKDMKMEYNDEFTVSFERELFANLAFDATFIYRIVYTSYMEDINAVFRDGAFVDRKFPDYDTIWQRTWYGGADRRWKFDYKGLQFNLRRNFTGRWGLFANYSLMWRNYYKLEFDPTDPDQFVYAAPGDLDMKNYGIRWAFKMSAFYRLPWEILVSTFVSGYSGIFQSDLTGNYAWDASAPLVTISNGRRVSDIVWQARNSYFAGGHWGARGRYTDDIWSVNLRLAKAFQVDLLRFEISCDFYNIFNWCGYGSYETLDIRRDFADSSGINHYKRMTDPQTPRTAQITFRVEF